LKHRYGFTCRCALIARCYFTGAEGASTTCTAALTCNFAQAIAALNDGGATPVIYTVAVGKGRDHMWIGAVDGLRINGKIFDFEKSGVIERGVPR
jgi:hypothetical protein